MEKEKKQEKKPKKKKKTKRTNRGKYSQSRVIKAIEGTGGIITEIATKLGCQRATVYAYLEKFPKVKKAYDDERDSVTDVARGNIVEAIFNGDLEVSMWWASRRDPDFTTKQQIQADVNNTGGVLMVPGVATDADAWSKAVQEQQAAILGKADG